jgi:hypothetical protein
MSCYTKYLTDDESTSCHTLTQNKNTELALLYVGWFFQQFHYIIHTGCLKIREFRIQRLLGKDPVELEKYLAAFISTVTKYYYSYVAVTF